VDFLTVDTVDSSAAAGSCTDNVGSTDSNSLLQKTRETLDKLPFNGSIDEEPRATLEDVDARLEKEKKTNEGSSTGHLWLQYIKMVDTLRRFLRAERISCKRCCLTLLQLGIICMPK